jgi:DNA-binding MarR family transcriptional regulator
MRGVKSGKHATKAAPPEQVFRQLVRTFGLVERVMQPYFAQFGISPSQWSLLRTLYRNEQDALPGLRLSELSERLLIRPPSVTGVVDRLERAGLVMRDGSLTDMRAKQVALTGQGRILVERILATHARQIEAVLDGLSAGEQSNLHQLLQRLGQHLEKLLLEKSARLT